MKTFRVAGHCDPRPILKERNKVSLTIPNQSETLSKIVRRLDTGNRFGVKFVPISYDVDQESDNFVSIEIDHSDLVGRGDELFRSSKQILSDHAEFEKAKQKKVSEDATE